ncbi:MAG: hypothetical protein BroJett011_59530 [Chloroflexota bacterium]|nr:MAG: hypothetical protein BroJett011_59530 [Chloroflexota bacterium]
MSCEKNQNQAAHAAEQSGGISSVVSKNAYLTGKILAAGLLFGAAGAGTVAAIHGTQVGMGRIKAFMEQWKAERAEAAARREEQRAQAGRRILAQLDDLDRKQAAYELQTTYLGKAISREQLLEVLNPTSAFPSKSYEDELDDFFGDDSYGDEFYGEQEDLGANLRMATGMSGQIIYEDTGDGRGVILAIRPVLGSEGTLHNRLAAYVSPDPEPKREESVSLPVDGNRVQKLAWQAKQWTGEHGEEIGYVVKNAVPAVAIAIGGYYLQSRLPEGSTRTVATSLIGARTSKAALGFHLANTGVQTIKGVQAVRRQREKGRRLAEALRQPERMKAVVALARDYDGGRVSRQNLEGLIGGQARQLVDNSWVVTGPLGTVYYDDVEDGQVSVRGVLPEAGKELQLRNGLEAIIQKFPAASTQSRVTAKQAAKVEVVT